jgi:hypothetical protein
MVGEPDQSDIIDAVVTELKLDDTSLNVYMGLTGEERIGAEDIGVSLGHSKSFFFDQIERNPKTLEYLHRLGFSGKQLWFRVTKQEEGKITVFLVKTVSIADFSTVMIYEAFFKRNLKAYELVRVFTQIGIQQCVENVFTVLLVKPSDLPIPP